RPRRLAGPFEVALSDHRRLGPYRRDALEHRLAVAEYHPVFPPAADRRLYRGRILVELRGFGTLAARPPLPAQEHLHLLLLSLPGQRHAATARCEAVNLDGARRSLGYLVHEVRHLCGSSL